MVTDAPAPAKMDDTFQSPNVGRPPEGRPIELWHGGGIIKGYKKDGAWHAEDGTSITVEGWRPIEPPAKPYKKPDAPRRPDIPQKADAPVVGGPVFKDDDGTQHEPTHRPRHK